MKKTGDQYLENVTIGDRVPHDGPVLLVPYDRAWPSRFTTLASRVHKALSGSVFRLEHVGSTSVPGLSAKPVIDMVLAVSDSTDEPAYIPALEKAGFALRIREPDWFEHRLLKSSDIAGNLHVFSEGCEEIERMTRFRDWLREHEADRRLYETTKRELAKRTWRHVQHYADAKSEVVERILARAREAPGQRG